MHILYNIAITIYHIAIHVASIFNQKARLWVNGRKDIFKQISASIDGGSQLVWFHCASLGEFEQARPLIEKFQVSCSKFQVLITFFSPSGYEIRKDYELADYVFYLPIDSKKNAERFINIVNPTFVLFVKYEFWYHYLNTLHQKQIPTYIVSANFRKEQLFFKWHGGWYLNMLKNITHIFVQNEKSKQLLQSVGITNSSVSGDTRFDRVYSTTQNVEKIQIVEQFINGKKIFIGGSTWKEGEELIIKLINDTKFDIKYIIAPHDIKEENIKRIIAGVNVKTIRFSQADEGNVKDATVLVIDNIGMLANLYAYADIVYVGGAFGNGLHNILEPSAFGMPILFGPNYSKFPEAQQLIEKGGAFSIANFKDLKYRIRFLLRDEMILRIASEVSRNYVRENRGATDKILSVLSISSL